jgi:hypothetical protein
VLFNGSSANQITVLAVGVVRFPDGARSSIVLIIGLTDLYAAVPAAYATERRPCCCYAFVRGEDETVKRRMTDLLGGLAEGRPELLKECL